MDNKQAAGLLKHHIKAWEGKFPSAHFEACKVAIKALTADKDEQAGRIMQMEEALRQTKTVINDLMACNEISKIADVRGEDAIKAIEALLGGKEDEKE